MMLNLIWVCCISAVAFGADDPVTTYQINTGVTPISRAPRVKAAPGTAENQQAINQMIQDDRTSTSPASPNEAIPNPLYNNVASPNGAIPNPMYRSSVFPTLAFPNPGK